MLTLDDCLTNLLCSPLQRREIVLIYADFNQATGVGLESFEETSDCLFKTGSSLVMHGYINGIKEPRAGSDSNFLPIFPTTDSDEAIGNPQWCLPKGFGRGIDKLHKMLKSAIAFL